MGCDSLRGLHGGRVVRALGSDRFLFVLVLVCVLSVHAPVVGSFFRDDDFLHFFRYFSMEPIGFLFSSHDRHLTVPANAVTMLLSGVFEPQPKYFYPVVLLTHLVNASLLYLIIRQVTGRSIPAAFVAVLWGAAPIHLHTLSWYVCYSLPVLALLVLWAILEVTAVAGSERPPTAWAIARWFVLMLLSALSWAAGIAIAMAFPIIVWLLLKPENRRLRVAAWLTPLVVAAPTLFLLLHSGDQPSSIWDGDARTLIGAVSATFSRHVGYGFLHLLSDPFLALLPPLQLPDAVLAIVAATALAILVWISLRADSVVRRQSAAFLLLSCSAYGIIALGRQGWGSPDLFRYQYLSPLGLYVVLGILLARVHRVLERPWITVSIVCLLLCVTVANSRSALQFRRLSTQSEHQIDARLARIAARISGAPPGSDVYIDNENPGIFAFYSNAVFFLMFFPEDRLDGRTVHFVERTTWLVDRIRARGDTPMSRLLVTPAEAELAQAIAPGPG